MAILPRNTRSKVMIGLLSLAIAGDLAHDAVLYARGPVSHSDWLNPPTKWIDGTIIKIDRDAKIISVQFGERDDKRTISVSAASDEPIIQIDDNTADFAALQSGMNVRLKYRGNVAIEIHARSGDSKDKK